MCVREGIVTSLLLLGSLIIFDYQYCILFQLFRFSFPVLPKIDGGERRTAVSEEIIRERTVANIDRNSDR